MLCYDRALRGWGQSQSVACLSVLVVGLCLACSLAIAQEDIETLPTDMPSAPAAAPTGEPVNYQTYPVDENLKRARSDIMTILEADRFAPGQDATVSNYYRQYALSRWTLPGNLTILPNLRKEFRYDLGRAKPGPIHDYLNALALDFLGKMAQANVHPGARYNAMLMIADLNSTEPKVGQDAVPLPEALPVLLAALADPKQIDAVRVAALIGVGRHAELRISDENARAQVLAAAMQIATAKSVPGRSAAGQAWMRVRAIETLGFLGTVGADGAVAKGLAAIVAQPPGNPLNVRCAAAAALGGLDYSQPSGLNVMETTAQLGQLALAACKDELPRMKQELQELLEEKQQQPKRPGAIWGDRRLGIVDRSEGVGKRPGVKPGEEEEEEKHVCRRRLKACLVAVKGGLVGSEGKPGGIASLAKEPTQRKFVTAITEPIDNWLNLLDDKKIEDKDLLKAIGDSLNSYGNLLQQAATTPAK